MLTIRYLRKFRRDIKRLKKQGKNLERLKTVIDLLAAEKALPAKYRDHALTGDRQGFRDCHIENDWVLVYRVKQRELCLVLARTGTHSELDL